MLHIVHGRACVIAVSYLAHGTDTFVGAATPRIPQHMPVGVIWHQPQPPQRCPQVALRCVGCTFMYMRYMQLTAHRASCNRVQTLVQDIGTELTLTSTVLSVSACDAKPW